MTHLGVDVAAFVDGQLSEQSTNAARAHLETCAECDKAVRQQEALKSRMSTVSEPTLSPAFLASLNHVPHACLDAESPWMRVRQSRAARFGVTLLGASMAVAVVAYGLGGVRDRDGDAVTPTAERYAADFFATESQSSSAVQASTALTPAAMAALDDSGWPCHETLAGDMDRIDAVRLNDGAAISLTYANEIHTLKLFEQNGALDVGGLAGFEERTIGDASVWIRDGIPRIVTWDRDGVVYTIVTDAGRRHLAAALKQLPTRGPDGGAVSRISDGLDRMTTWISPAA